MRLQPYQQLFAIALFFIYAGVACSHEGHSRGTNDPSSRVWTFQDTGSHIHGTYVSSLDGKVLIRKQDGNLISIAIVQLTKADRQWIDRRATEIQEMNEATNGRIIFVQTPITVEIDTIANTFEPYAKLNALKYRRDDRFFFVESNGMPGHRMMVGITAWQQQVPIPQSYFGDNAWRIPLFPTVAKKPLSAKSHFFRGAIALAANGIQSSIQSKTMAERTRFWLVSLTNLEVIADARTIITTTSHQRTCRKWWERESRSHMRWMDTQFMDSRNQTVHKCKVSTPSKVTKRGNLGITIMRPRTIPI